MNAAVFIVMFCLASSFCGAAGNDDPLSPKTTDAEPSSQDGIQYYDFKFDRAPIQEVAQFYGTIMGKAVIISSNCFATFTFSTDRNLTKEEAKVVIESNLRGAGITLLNAGDQIELSMTHRPTLSSQESQLQQIEGTVQQAMLNARGNRLNKASQANAKVSNEVPSSMLCMEVYDIALKRSAEEGVNRDVAGRVKIGYLGTSGVWKVTFIAGTNSLNTELLIVLVDDRTQKIISVEKPVVQNHKARGNSRENVDVGQER